MGTNGPRLELQDGTIFSGSPFGAWGPVAGEVVFNTGMVGYVESLTDPSYRGQVLVLTYPLVGNYGVPDGGPDGTGLPRGFESERIQVSGLIVSNLSWDYSHHDAAQSLSDWLKSEGVPGLTGVDTRALTKRLRARGVMPGRLVSDKLLEFEDPNERDLASEVRPDEAVIVNPGAGPRVAVVDAGVKLSIVRGMVSRGFEVVRVPYDEDPLAWEPAGVLIGNGPGDPARYTKTAAHIKGVLEAGVPVLGVCLGCQMLAMAAGARTFKLPYGHRSQNQPAVEAGTGRCLITSQNHGYAVDPATLPADWEVSFTNANDGTCEGVRSLDGRALAVQFHPEARPGPRDAEYIFERFERMVKGGGGGGT
jgi:carbamoyl-phosphate synthase small subunit